MKYVIVQLLLMISLFVSLFYDFYRTGIQGPLMLRLIAGLLILGSLVLAILSFISLNQSFALRPKPSAKGKLVTSGIYAYIQHPMYTSVLVFFLGACILLLSFRSFVILPLLALWMFLKSGVEEKFLLKVYQTDYRDYSKKTGRFLPRINRWR